MDNLKKIRRQGSALVLALGLLLMRADALEVQVKKTEIDNYGIQEIPITLTTKDPCNLLIESSLVDYQDQVLSKSTVSKDLIGNQTLDLKTHVQVLDRAYKLQISFKDQKNLETSYPTQEVIVRGGYFKEEIKAINNPIINRLVGEDFYITDHSLKAMLNTGETIDLKLMPINGDYASEFFDVNQLGPKTIEDIIYYSDDWKYTGSLDLVFNYQEARPVKEIPQINKTIRQGEEIGLPREVEVIYQDGTSLNQPVIWDGQLDPTKLGEQIIKGRVMGTIYQASFKLVVEDYQLQDPYIFKNPNVEDAVVGQLGPKPTYEDLLNMKSFTMNWYDDSNFSDLAYMKNLEYLDLSFGLDQNPDLSPLQGLKDLISFNIFNGNVESIDFLKDLVNLRQINLGSNNIRDISPLASLINLESLNLSSNPGLVDIRALRFTPNLRYISLPNSVEDLTPLAEYNGKLDTHFEINFLEGSGGKLSDKVSLGKTYYPPYGVKMDGDLTYVNWEEGPIIIDGEREVKGSSSKGEIVLSLSLDFRDDSEIIRIPDRIFEEEVRKSIDKRFGDIHYGDIKNLKYLDLSAKGVKDFTGLENFIGLRNLKLWASPDFTNKDLEKVQGMKNLEYIDLGSTGITKITNETFKGMDKIIEIALDNTKLYDIPKTAFQTNKSIVWLHVNGLGITNLDFLEGLENLESLYADENRITDIKGLAFTPKLKTLRLSYNSITDTKVLASLTSLENLDIDHNSISDISSLESIETLKQFNGQNNKFENIEGLRSSIGLEICYLNTNKIRNIEALANMKKLRQVQLKNNNIKDVSPLAGLENLKVLHLAGNPIENLTTLKDIYPNLTNKDFEL